MIPIVLFGGGTIRNSTGNAEADNAAIDKSIALQRDVMLMAAPMPKLNLALGVSYGFAAKGVANTSGWVKRSVFNSLDSAIQKKVAAAIQNVIVAPTGKQGIIKLTATEAAQTGYQYKVKILGKGGDIRIYGNPMGNGHIFFDKIMGH